GILGVVTVTVTVIILVTEGILIFLVDVLGLIVEAKDKGVEIATAVGKQMLEKNVFIFGAVDYDEASTTEKLHQSISYRTHLCGGNEVDLSSMHKQSIEYAEAKKSTMKSAGEIVEIGDVKHIAEEKELMGEKVEKLKEEK
ncbi:hypothetical protein HID58_058352, partial [Brassica napus]